METENYAKATLQALNQGKDFAVGVLQFLMLEAINVGSDYYHYGNSTLFYRTEIPEQQKEVRVSITLEEIRVHINLDLIARNTQALSQDLAAITTEFPEFSIKKDSYQRVRVPVSSN